MKRSSLLLAFMVLPLVAGTFTRTLDLSVQDLVFYGADGQDVIELRDQTVLAQPGAPRLPRIVEKLVIPAGAVLSAVRIVDVAWQEIPGTFNVVPAQPDVPLPMPDRVFEPTIVPPDPAIYSLRTPFPGVAVRAAGTGNLNGYRIAHVELFPVRYTPAQGKLELATRITYEVAYEEHRVPDVIATVRQQEVFGQAMRALVVNPGDVARFAPRVGAGLGSRAVPPGYYEYVIISAPPMDTVFARLAAWKTKKGVPATVVDMAWIGSSYTGYDLAEKVRNFIIDARDNWGTIYVLLGGSGDYRTAGQNIVPTRKARYMYAGGPDGDSLPSDLYYGDLDGTWDFNNNHVYGELADSVDMYADVHVGRASVYTVALAQNFVSKVFAYEKSPATAHLRKMLLPTAILWSSYNERPMQDSIARMTPAGWVDGKLYERNGTLSRQWMIDSMNVGYGLGHWVGHGSETGIYMGSTPYLNSTDADNLVNGDRQGIANSIGCMCGGWDLTPNSDCFAERLVNRVGGGLVAALMNSRYGWGAYVSGIGYVPGPSERIDTTFYYNLLTADMWRLGPAHSASKDAWVFYADSNGQYDMTRWCIYELNLFGDPEMPVWTDLPAELAVSYPAVIPMGAQAVNVVVTSGGQPVANALVCLQKGAEAYASDYTNAAGLVTLAVTPTSPGAMDLTVTALNHYPFEDSLLVQASNYAYVTYLKCTVSDPSPGGNNNGQLNAGESVELPVWVKNWGQNQGTGITGALGTASAHATLSDTLKNFGNIAANDSAYSGADGFNVAIAPACPDQSTVLFTLTCRDNVDSTWTSQFSLTVHAPQLVYEQHTVAGGNNILEPGETADLVLTLRNEGSAAAGNVSATLICASPLLTVNDNGGSFGMILPDSAASNGSDPFNVTASSSAAYGTLVSCALVIGADFYADTVEFELPIGEPVPSDTGHYYVYYSGGLHAYAPVFEWFAIAPPGPGTIVSAITDEDADTVTVTLPFIFRYYGTDYTTVGLCSNGFLELGTSTYRFGSNTGIPSTGGPRAMIAAFWADLDPSLAGDIYQYHDAANHRWILEFSDVAYYGAVNDRQTFQVILLDPDYYATPTGDGEILVQYLNAPAQTAATFGIEDQTEDVGIQYYYNGAYHEWAAAVTDSFALRYTTYPPDYVGVQEFGNTGDVPRQTRLTRLTPNPCAGALEVNYQIAVQGLARLRVYDALGRTVCALAEGMAEPGYYTVTWPGRDEQGRRLPAGVYFVRLETDAGQDVQKVVWLR